ncbi:MAG: uroporphyrinogen decarboxylase family protein [Kiritimatiellales bacterium]
MNSRERVLTALHHAAPDRVPVNYMANSGIDRRLKNHFDLAPDDHTGLRKALNIDFFHSFPLYIGPAVHPPVDGLNVDEWGVRTRWVEHGSGGYWDFCDFPLKDAEGEELSLHKLPDPDTYDYDAVVYQFEAEKNLCRLTGHAGVGDIINHTGRLRGMEQVLCDIALQDEAYFALVDRYVEQQLTVYERLFSKAKGQIDLFWMGEDLGTQIAPIISPVMYQELIKPHHKKYADLAATFNIPVMIHSCGSSSWAFNDFIELGISAVDTLQPEAVNMSPEYLKKTFGNRLAFHGCISTAGVLAGGTVEDVIECCRNTLDVMMPGGGYCFAPTHMIQDNSPVENVLAMYKTANEYGVYKS